MADRFYGDRVKLAFAFAELLNQEVLALQADGVDIIQFDEPASNVYMDDAAGWGGTALERAAQGLKARGAANRLSCTMAVHICYGYSFQAAVRIVPRAKLIARTNCGLVPMSREVAEAKLKALADGAALDRARQAA